jgi:hypothetical protein
MNGDDQRFKSLAIIRLSYVIGPALFILVTYLQRRFGSLGDVAMPADKLVLMRYLHWGVAAFALFWALFWKSRTESAMDAAGVSRALIIGWAPGEAAALFGGVIYFVGGPLSAAAFGFVAFAVVLSLLRIPRRHH